MACPWGGPAWVPAGQVWCHPFLVKGLAGANLQNRSLIFSYSLPGAGAGCLASRNAAKVRLRPPAQLLPGPVAVQDAAPLLSGLRGAVHRPQCRP